MGDPFRTELAISIPAPTEMATLFLAEQIGQRTKDRPVLRTMVGDHDCGTWQVEAVHTVREDAGYDQLYATLRRVLV